MQPKPSFTPPLFIYAEQNNGGFVQPQREVYAIALQAKKEARRATRQFLGSTL